MAFLDRTTCRQLAIGRALALREAVAELVESPCPCCHEAAWTRLHPKACWLEAAGEGVFEAGVAGAPQGRIRPSPALPGEGGKVPPRG